MFYITSDISAQGLAENGCPKKKSVRGLMQPWAGYVVVCIFHSTAPCSLTLYHLVSSSISDINFSILYLPPENNMLQ